MTLSGFATLSSLFYLPAIVVLWAKAPLETFWPEGLALLFACFASIVYHACDTTTPGDNVAWCPDKSPDVSMERDVTAAYLALLFALTPVLYYWVNPRLRAAYAIALTVLTSVLVVLYRDGPATMLTLGLIHAVALLSAAWWHRRQLMQWGKAYKLLLLVAVGFGALAIIFRSLSRADFDTAASDARLGQGNTYQTEHGLWHLFGGASVFAFYLAVFCNANRYEAVTSTEPVKPIKAGTRMGKV